MPAAASKPGLSNPERSGLFSAAALAARRGLLPERTWEAIVASYQSQY
jgi:hypothetical protein